MKISVTVQRSENWVKARRIETGENVPSEIKVEIETTDLSPTTRQLLLEYKSGYQDIEKIKYDSTLKPNEYASYGYAYIKIDSDAPTPTEIDQAIMAAFAEIKGKRIKWEIEQAEREEAERQEEDKRKYREHELERARILLKDELDSLKGLEAKHELLSEFVSWIPDDACRGALKAMHQDQTEGSLTDLQKRIEDASSWTVFDVDGDGDTDEE